MAEQELERIQHLVLSTATDPLERLCENACLLARSMGRLLTIFDGDTPTDGDETDLKWFVVRLREVVCHDGPEWLRTADATPGGVKVDGISARSYAELAGLTGEATYVRLLEYQSGVTAARRWLPRQTELRHPDKLIQWQLDGRSLSDIKQSQRQNVAHLDARSIASTLDSWGVAFWLSWDCDELKSRIVAEYQRASGAGETPDDAPQRDADDPQGADDTAFVPAKSLWQDKFDTYSKFRNWLKQNQNIRTRKPSKNRLEIHSGDWVRAWNFQSDAEFKSLDAAEVEQDCVEEIEKRKTALRNKKTSHN